MKRHLCLALFAPLAVVDADTAPLTWSRNLLRQKPDWFASPAGRTALDNVLRYQSTEGGWPKNTNLLAPATADALAEIQRGGKANTIDNQATTLPLRFLAAATAATGDARCRTAVERGLDYLLYMDRDSKPLYDFSLVSYERRSGYGYHTTAPAELLHRDYPAWRRRLSPSLPPQRPMP
jgi:hypothetical protein